MRPNGRAWLMLLRGEKKSTSPSESNFSSIHQKFPAISLRFSSMGSLSSIRGTGPIDRKSGIKMSFKSCQLHSIHPILIGVVVGQLSSIRHFGCLQNVKSFPSILSKWITNFVFWIISRKNDFEVLNWNDRKFASGSNSFHRFEWNNSFFFWKDRKPSLVLLKTLKVKQLQRRNVLESSRIRPQRDVSTWRWNRFNKVIAANWKKKLKIKLNPRNNMEL